MNDDLREERALVFDFARVVFRWRPDVVVANALAARRPDAAAVRGWVGQIFLDDQGEWAEFDRGTIAVPDLARRIAARTGLDASEVLAIVAAAQDELQPLPDTVAWLRDLHAQGRPLHFLSNMPEPYARHVEREHDFLSLFESGVISARVGFVKPQPEIFAHASKVYRRAPHALLFLDDHLPNVVAARAAGWQAVHFIDAVQARAEVEALGW